MKSFKENTLVKMVYAYIDLFYKAFPFFFVLLFIPLVGSYLVLDKSELGRIDVFGLLGNEKVTDVSGLMRIGVIVLNLAVLTGIFLSLKKLRLFIKNVFENNPYCIENGRHLKFIGILVAVLTGIFHFTKVIVASSKAGTLVSSTTVFLINLAGILGIIFNPYVVLGLFVVVLGEIIIQGAKIKEENDLTV